MLVIFLAYQQVENHILNPVIMSKTVRLNPFWVLIAVLVGATLGGKIAGGLGSFVGALIGIPSRRSAPGHRPRGPRRGPDDIDPLERAEDERAGRGCSPGHAARALPSDAGRAEMRPPLGRAGPICASKKQVGGGRRSGRRVSWRPGQGGDNT